MQSEQYAIQESNLYNIQEEQLQIAGFHFEDIEKAISYVEDTEEPL